MSRYGEGPYAVARYAEKKDLGIRTTPVRLTKLLDDEDEGVREIAEYALSNYEKYPMDAAKFHVNDWWPRMAS
ncbi:MAG: hypothetical protein KIH01_00745 [Candidatus Freyarchaeota archaeon]|nr:hypothetical protein [Candidatus Jordarchaeia archaeon]